eukprot:472800-Prymnesium_polylepis.1
MCTTCRSPSAPCPSPAPADGQRRGRVCLSGHAETSTRPCESRAHRDARLKLGGAARGSVQRRGRLRREPADARGGGGKEGGETRGAPPEERRRRIRARACRTSARH